MMSGNPQKEAAPPTQRRFVYPLIALIALGWGLKYSMDSRARLCPPGNPDCGPLPPSLPAAAVPPATPPR